MWEINMWWNCSVMPEYLLNNQEEYIGGQAAAFRYFLEFVLKAFGFGAIFYFIGYYLKPGTPVGGAVRNNYARELKESAEYLRSTKAHYTKDFMGSSNYF